MLRSSCCPGDCRKKNVFTRKVWGLCTPWFSVLRPPKDWFVIFLSILKSKAVIFPCSEWKAQANLDPRLFATWNHISNDDTKGISGISNQNRIRKRSKNANKCLVSGSGSRYTIAHVLHRVSEANMSRQTTLGRFGFEKSFSQRNSVMETNVLDFFNYVKGNCWFSVSRHIKIKIKAVQ